MRAASATVRINIGVLPLSDAQRSRWLSSESVCRESVTEDMPHKSNRDIEGSLCNAAHKASSGETHAGASRSLNPHAKSNRG
jgi:hypothetical protein